MWKSQFGKINAPENPMFKEVHDRWPSIDKTSPRVLDIAECSEWLQQKRLDALDELRLILSRDREFLPRDDYRELAELAMMVLGEAPPRGVHLSVPGACHQARWMAQNLYLFKMYMFQDQLGYSTGERAKIEKMVIFNAIFYVPYWFRCSSAVDAAINDLRFIQDMTEFIKYYPVIASVAMKKLKAHAWYLTQELVVLAFFSKAVSNAQKEKIAQALKGIRKPKRYRLGIPVFPKLSHESELHELVGPQSYFLFDRMNVSTDFLEVAVETWPNNSSYLKMSDSTNKFKVTNDVAERGIQLMQQFQSKITKDEVQKQHLYKTVDKHRKTYKDFKKSTFTAKTEN